jgi:hypothetical protein
MYKADYRNVCDDVFRSTQCMNVLIYTGMRAVFN